MADPIEVTINITTVPEEVTVEVDQSIPGDIGPQGPQGPQGEDGPIFTNTYTASHVLTSGDAYHLINMDVASSNTVSVPTNATEPFEIGARMVVRQAGSGPTTIVGDMGVTILSQEDAFTMAGRYAMATIIKLDTDLWALDGNLIP